MGEDDGYLRTRNSVQLAKVELVDPSILTVPNNHIKNVETRIYYLAKQYKRE